MDSSLARGLQTTPGVFFTRRKQRLRRPNSGISTIRASVSKSKTAKRPSIVCKEGPDSRPRSYQLCEDGRLSTDFARPLLSCLGREGDHQGSLRYFLDLQSPALALPMSCTMEAQIESKELSLPLLTGCWKYFESISIPSAHSPPIRSISFNEHRNESVTGQVLNKWKDARPRFC